MNCESEILRKKYICESNTVNDMKLMILEKIRVIRTSCSSRKTLDWGGKGGKGGGNEAYQKWLCTTPYFLVIAEKDEKLSQKLSHFFFLESASCKLRSREDFFVLNKE